jgi:ceramide glucosyltransferase
MPPDYLQRLLATWRADTGLVSAPPVGSHPENFWAGLECAFLNTYEVRWQYAADTFGFGFAQGKTLLYRRADLATAGGLRALASEAAEDAASTKLIRAAGLRVRLVDAPFQQPLGHRRWADVWSRQVRWAQLRRASFPMLYVLEILGNPGAPLVAAALAAATCDLPIAGVVVPIATLWYAAEMALAAAAGWHLPLTYPAQALLRDLMLPALWIAGWRDRGFVWRGNAMNVDDARRPEAA